jgi:hypothetical protein
LVLVATAGAHTTGGRPPRGVRNTPRRPGWYGCEDRIAWLLRANRLYGEDERLRSATAFTAAFPGGAWPESVSASVISRWETAASRADFRVLRRYEQLLGVPTGHLLAVADWIYRKASSRIGPPVLSRRLRPETPLLHERAEELLERVLSAETMAGAQWEELTGLLAVLPTVLLYPRSAWAELAERLLGELLIADGMGWLNRTEALSRLMIHPAARRAVVAACGELAADPTNQVIIEPLTILDMTGERDANRYVLSQLAHPSSSRALRGALLSSIEKVPRHHFRPPELHQLATAAADLLDDDDLYVEARQLAAELLRQTAGAGVSSVTDRLRRGADPVTRSILDFGQTAAPNSADQTVERVAAAASARLGAPRDDRMLHRLLSELLFSANSNDRVLAGFIVAATPYREPVGAALVTELSAAARSRAVPLVTAMLGAMPFVGRPADRGTVEEFLTAAVPVPVAEAAAWALGHVPGRSDTTFWREAAQAHRRGWLTDRTRTADSTLRGLIYALGISGEEITLREIQMDTMLPAQARTAAGWWLRIPARTRASAAS